MILSDIDKKGEKSGEKEVIKVFVITGPKTNGVVTYENEVSGQKVYSGIAWDTLEAAKKHPDLKKYKFEYTFSEPTFTNYTVQDGDNLWNIAGNQYGDAKSWIILLWDNEESIKVNAGILNPGMTLKLRTKLDPNT